MRNVLYFFCLFILSATAQASGLRPQSEVRCLVPHGLDLGARLEVYFAPPTNEQDLDWDTVIEIATNDRLEVQEERQIQVSYDSQGDLYLGQRFTLRLTQLNNGILYGELTDTQNQFRSSFHCKKMR